MIIKPQDIMVVLKLVASGWPGSYAALGTSLSMSASEVHAAFRRARQAGFILPGLRQVNKSALAEFLLHGLRYVLAVQPGGPTRGLATGFAAAPLAAHFRISAEDPNVPVWPAPWGKTVGLEITPLCRSAPMAARLDAELYEWLVLADALRGVGRARERELAQLIVKERLGYHAPH